jgi:hypothetical protein
VISRRSSNKFADLAAGYGVVRTIEQVYQAHDFYPPDYYEYPESGIRRATCDAHEAGIDRTDASVSARLLLVYADGIEDWGRRDIGFITNTGAGDDPFVPDARALIRSLQRDGAPIADDGKVSPAVLVAPLSVDRFQRLSEPQVLMDHLARIEASIGTDPAAAIGSSKELVESVLKFVLDDYGVQYAKAASVPDLYKLVASELGLSREAVPGNKKGSDAAQRVLQGLITAVQNLAELRNELGLGHGRTTSSPALARHGRLAANAARTIVEFVLETWHVRKVKGAP